MDDGRSLDCTIWGVIEIRSLLRNQQPVFFKNLIDMEELVDEYGNSLGSYLPIYSNLKSAMLCVSPNKGSSEVEQFGSLEDYDRTMTTSDPSCLIDEDSVLWVDGADTDGPYNYIVKRKAPWKNSVQYAIKKVSVSEYEAEQKLFARKAEIEAAMLSAKDQTEAEHGLDQRSVEGSQGVSEEG